MKRPGAANATGEPTIRISTLVRPALLIVAGAFALRIWGLGFGLPFGYARPDETMIAGPAVGFLSGDFTPPDYRYPTFLMYVTALLYAVYYLVTRRFAGYATLAAFAGSRYRGLEPFFYLTRGLSALMGSITVWWVYAMGRELFDEAVGAVAVPFAAAVIERLSRNRHAFRLEVAPVARATLVFALVFVAAFLAGSPYIPIEWHRFVRDVTTQGTATLEGHGVAVSRGWFHHARITLPVALGWPVYLAGLAGAGGIAVTRFRQAAVLLAFPVAYYIVAGTGYVVFARYMIPVLPFLCICAAWLVAVSVRAALAEARPGVRAAALVVVTVAMAAPSARQSILLDRLLSRTDNRVIVARALRSLMPPGSLVLHSGGRYGHVPFDLPGETIAVTECEYDEESGRFTPCDRPPDRIIIQRSGLALYSDVPAGLERVVREQYDLVRAFPTGMLGSPRVYDQQDAFFLPLGGLDGIRRPGPEFEIYRRRR